MDSRAVAYVYDRPGPVHDQSSTTATSFVYDRPTPVHAQLSSIACAHTYDRTTPVYAASAVASAYSYDSATDQDPTQIQVWDGAQWVRKPQYVWNGSGWVPIT